MKKILFLAVFAFVMSSCSKKASPQKATILNATENFLPYDFATKKIVDDNGGPKKVQFKIDSAITVSQTVRVDYVNDRGDVADSNKLETRFIPAGTECLLADEKTVYDSISKAISFIYKMEFKMKETDELVYLYFTGIPRTDRFTILADPRDKSKIKVSFAIADPAPKLWNYTKIGQKLLYSKVSSGGANSVKATDNRIPGR